MTMLFEIHTEEGVITVRAHCLGRALDFIDPEVSIEKVV